MYLNVQMLVMYKTDYISYVYIISHMFYKVSILNGLIMSKSGIYCRVD